MCQKNWAGVSPSLPVPNLTQYIQFVKSGQKNWAGPSPLIWTKSKRTATFFGRPSLSLIKPSQIMFMIKFSTTALNFGYYFVLLVHSFWDNLYVLQSCTLNFELSLLSLQLVARRLSPTSSPGRSPSSISEFQI